MNGSTPDERGGVDFVCCWRENSLIYWSTGRNKDDKKDKDDNVDDDLDAEMFREYSD